MSARYDMSWLDSWGPRREPESGIKVPTMNEHNNLLSFLAIFQYYLFDFLTFRWKDGLDPIGHGGTADVRGLLVTEQNTFAYKQHKELILVDSTVYKPENSGIGQAERVHEKIFNQMVSEVTILGHPLIRNHQNIIRLEGAYWEVPTDGSPPWPILVFERADLGDLWSFAKSAEGLEMSFEKRLGICLDVTQAVSALHNLGRLCLRGLIQLLIL